MIIFSLNILQSRANNLEIILPNILKQSDFIYVNLIGFREIPKILLNEKIKINNFFNGGSELRFFNYNDCNEDDYYFTIDDDIIYPENYVDVVISNMKAYNNDVVCCIHGSIVNLEQKKDYYKRNRIVYHFKNELIENKKVIFPGVGTSCFYGKKFKINLTDFKASNMSDIYVGCFLYQQNIPIISIKRKNNWLLPIITNDKTIWGNNNHEKIDEMINKTFI